ncbi:MAG: Trk system potassium transporter TrkA [Pseudomonadota bacterium]
MKVIICGAGQVGYGIARRLASEGGEVTVIDRSKDLIRSITEKLDVKGLVGHGSHPHVLDKAGAKDADMVIAVTFSDEVNMVACQICHSLFSVPTKIARIRAQAYRDPTWQDLFSRKNMPIDVVISPEQEVAETILRRFRNPGAFETVCFVDGRVEVVGVRLEEDCPVVDTPIKQLVDLFPDLRATVAGVIRQDHLFTPDSDDQMMVGDDVFFVADRAHVARALDIFGHAEAQARRVILIGGGNVGLFVARSLEQIPGLKVRLIESSKDRAEAIAEQLARTVVLHGDGLDRELLREAGVTDAETVLTVTNDDQVNILSGVIAKREGAARVLALINNRDYARLVEPLGIDAFVDPRATTVSKILEQIRKGRIKGVFSIRDGEAEVIDAIALETSPLVGSPLKDVRLPDGIVVGAIYRDDDVIMPTGSTQIRAGDRVVIFALREHVRTVEQMFRVSLEYF